MTADGRPDPGFTALTARLAELLASEEGSLAIAQLQRLALLERRTDETHPPGSLRIGVWTPRLTDAGEVELVRDPALAHEWRYWADVERIAPKRGSRVVLLGESVARGYLYDPRVTPAAVLERMLDGVEVIDLARTDLDMSGLELLLDALYALEPDAVVLFAGNNWHTFLFELEELGVLAAAVRRGGWAELRRVFVDELVVRRGATVLDRLAAATRELGVPVVVVVPEFNLADWQDDVDVSATGATDGERESLEEARDAVFGLLVGHSPRCPAPVQQLLRRAAGEHGFRLVDLPRVLRAAGGGRPPDRSVFLDYCHLTLGGMQLAMAAVAGALAEALDIEADCGAAFEIDPLDEAYAHLLAAVHNAHWGQGEDILRYHCARAVDLSPAARGLLESLLDSFATSAEPWLSASFARVCQSPIAARYLVPVDPRAKLADFRLVAAIADTLEARDHADTLLASEGAQPGEVVDLLDPRCRATSFGDRRGHTRAPQPAFFRAHGPRSRFYLVTAVSGLARLELTCRVRGAGDVAVAVADEVETLDAGPRWRTFSLETRVRRGVNVVELSWPPPVAARDEHEHAARRLERGVYPDVLPVYGEAHAFRAFVSPRSPAAAR